MATIARRTYRILVTPKDLSATDPLYSAYFYMTVNCLFIIYKAYLNRDPQMIAFVLLLYFSYFSTAHSLTELDRMRGSGETREKQVLKSSVWFLSTLTGFLFANRFSQLVNVRAAVVLVYVVAASTSAGIFYAYFVHDLLRRRRWLWLKSKRTGMFNRDDRASPVAEKV